MELSSEMAGVTYAELLRAAAPELVLLAAALLVLAADLVALRGVSARVRWLVTGLLSWVGCGAAAAVLVSGAGEEPGRTAILGFATDGLAVWVKGVVLVLSALTVGLAMAATRTRHVGEYLALILLGTVGLMLLAGASDLLMVFLALELSSLVLYVLTGFEKQRPEAAEAALKYFLVGSVAAGFTLYGMSLVYGVAGTTQLQALAHDAVGAMAGVTLWAGLVLMLGGLAFKVAAAPFHLWAPDAYEAAPAPSAALIASGSKVAAFAVLARVLMTGLPQGSGSAAIGSWAPGWTTLLAGFSVLSLLWGNLAALVQTNVRRLLAYSAVAHAGYGLLGLIAHERAGLAALLYFAATYGLSAVGAFGVVAVVEAHSGGRARLSDFAGLSRRAPGVAVCLMVFLLSLAGIPPLAGFFGKFYLFLAALGAGQPLGLLWLVVLAVALSTVSLYYYLVVLKEAWVKPAPADTEAESWRLPWQVQLTLWAAALGVLLLGLFPSMVLRSLESALASL
ncbi:MAG: NADH-quinone oxidoreductase subunit N [Limisphaera sp.]|nr:MAG: NADH-quinone oxidoreductase subunit N [Limisphaera sp.]